MENKEIKPDYKTLTIDNVEYETLLTKKYVDRKKYEEYKYQYLTSRSSEGKSSRDIFVDYVLQS